MKRASEQLRDSRDRAQILKPTWPVFGELIQLCAANNCRQVLPDGGGGGGGLDERGSVLVESRKWRTSKEAAKGRKSRVLKCETTKLDRRRLRLAIWAHLASAGFAVGFVSDGQLQAGRPRLTSASQPVLLGQ